jgi:hypothetical protein
MGDIMRKPYNQTHQCPLVLVADHIYPPLHDMPFTMRHLLVTLLPAVLAAFIFSQHHAVWAQSETVVENSRGEPSTQVIVTTGQTTRVDELRVRGITQHITVAPSNEHAGWKAYQINPKGSQRDATTQGRSSWRVVGF